MAAEVQLTQPYERQAKGQVDGLERPQLEMQGQENNNFAPSKSYNHASGLFFVSHIPGSLLTLTLSHE
jgi:hypothetical protein